MSKVLTVAPSRANASVSWRPMPIPPPVTAAVLPSSLPIAYPEALWCRLVEAVCFARHPLVHILNLSWAASAWLRIRLCSRSGAAHSLGDPLAQMDRSRRRERCERRHLGLIRPAHIL